MAQLLLIFLSLVAMSLDNSEANMIIEKKYELPFTTDVVYAAWVSSATVIPPATEMDIDPVVGGLYKLIMKSAEFTSSNVGEFLAVDPGRHVRYTWEWNGDGEITEIDVTFAAIETGTRISIIHSGFQQQESADVHDGGWDSYIGGFSAFLAEQENVPDGSQ